jgi:dTDP-4-dehydrorhamnose reductase
LATTRRPDQVGEQRPYLDLAGSCKSWQLPEEIEVTLLCVGATSGQTCAQDREGTWRVNVEAPLRIAEHYAHRGARIIFYSSSQVFDGKQIRPLAEAPLNPVTEYGRQKAEVERRLISRFGRNATVLRLTKVWGERVPLLNSWVKALSAGETIRPFSDMFLAPIPLSTVLAVTSLVAAQSLSGILQLSADKDLSYSQVAGMACRVLGADKRLIKPISARKAKPDIGEFPRLTALAPERLRQLLGVDSPPAEWTVNRAIGQAIAQAGLTP